MGTFLTDPTDVPTGAVEFVAAQLGLDAGDLKGYGEKEARWDHQAQIRQFYGTSHRVWPAAMVRAGEVAVYADVAVQ